MLRCCDETTPRALRSDLPVHVTLWHRPLLGPTAQARGVHVRLLPVQYVRPLVGERHVVRRSKTDRAARINATQGLLLEYGYAIPVGTIALMSQTTVYDTG